MLDSYLALQNQTNHGRGSARRLGAIGLRGWRTELGEPTKDLRQDNLRVYLNNRHRLHRHPKDTGLATKYIEVTEDLRNRPYRCNAPGCHKLKWFPSTYMAVRHVRRKHIREVL